MPAETPRSGALPVSAEQWRLYLAELNDWYLRLPASFTASRRSSCGRAGWGANRPQDSGAE